ncbi:winged helix-turn-helix transcriptional regulator [Massilia sp. B-10]|nr:winged helix-turn-helix transcriptional regulator [Massilia sp. B-10]
MRELLCGSKRFNDVHRGVPRMSTSLLAQRLRHLEEIGVVRRVACGKVWEYSLTEAGEELRPIILALGEWGARWVGGALAEHELDPGLLLWDMRRSLRPDAFPAGTTVVAIRFHDARPGEQLWWLLVHERVAKLCREDPGRELTLIIESSVRALTEIWRGDLTPSRGDPPAPGGGAGRCARLGLAGPQRLRPRRQSALAAPASFLRNCVGNLYSVKFNET